MWRSACDALSAPFAAQPPLARTTIPDTALELTYHGDNRWGMTEPDDPFAHTTSLLLGLTPTTGCDQVLYLSVHGGDAADQFGGLRCGLSIDRAVELLRRAGAELTGFDPIERAEFAVLLSCNGCQEYDVDGVRESRAARLSARLNRPVLAPDGLIAVYHRPTCERPPSVFTVASGAFDPSDPQFKRQGQWKTQSAHPLTGEQKANRERLETYYRELAEDSERRVVAEDDEGKPVNPIARFVNQRLRKERRALDSSPADPLTDDEIRFL